MLGPKSETGALPVFGAGMPLARAVKLDRDGLLDALRDVIGPTGARVRLLDAPGSGGFLSGLR